KNTQSWYLNLSRSVLYLFDAINLRRVFNRVSKSGAQVIVFDRFIYDQLATLPVQSAWASAYVRMILKIAPEPDVAYVLDAMPEAARARKPEYPVDFLYKYRRSYLQLCDMAGLALIDPMPRDDVHEAIKSKLAKYGVFHQQEPELDQLTSI
ncbi:MAG: thymidylate kinase, partial [Acidobacteriota bacterium]|nr:thymidylate kinase [Acidobacteriota bacterium]